MAESIVLIVDDLMFLPNLEQSLRQQGYQPFVATNEADLVRVLNQAPVLVIIDLFSPSFDWQTLLRFIKGPGKKSRHIPVLGFGPHVDLTLREQALQAGCAAVVGRSAITTQLPRLVKQYQWLVDPDRCQAAPPPQLVAGLALFNQGQYFVCHEVIEQAWLEESSPVRLMYQGILQIGVACYHLQHKNWRGAMKLLERGIPKIRRFAPTCMGINLAKLITDAGTLRQALIRLGPDWPGEYDQRLFPTIEWSK